MFLEVFFSVCADVLTERTKRCATFHAYSKVGLFPHQEEEQYFQTILEYVIYICDNPKSPQKHFTGYRTG